MPGADELRQAEAQAAAAWNSLNLDALLSLFSDDALFLAPNQPILRGKAAIREALSVGFALPGFWVRVEPQEHVAEDDIGYTVSTYESGMSGGSHRGKYLAVWRQEAGAWKVVAHSSSMG